MDDLGFDPANLFDDAEGTTKAGESFSSYAEGTTKAGESFSSYAEGTTKPANHGRRWLVEQRVRLEQQCQTGETVEQIAARQGRSPGAIITQRKKLAVRDLVEALAQSDQSMTIYQTKYQLTDHEMAWCYHQAVFSRYRLDHPIQLRSRRR